MNGAVRIRRTIMATAVFLAGAGGTALAATSTVTFSDTGEHHVVVPSGVTKLHVVAVGARGGAGNYEVPGGFGARVVGDLAVSPGNSLYLQVGGAGTLGSNFGGGGGGGGASDIRRRPADDGLTPTDSRVLIAAGGGGSGRGYDFGADGTAGYGGSGGMPGGDSRNCASCLAVSGGGGAGIPTGTGAGGHSGATPGNDGAEDVGAAGTLGLGGTGAHIDENVQRPAPGGYNGGGGGGGYTELVFGTYIQHRGGGGGGGGLNGGGGGGGVRAPFGRGADAGAGGGGGSNLLPAGGSATVDATGTASITLSYADSVAPVVSLDEPPSPLSWPRFSGTSGTVLGDGPVTVRVYAGASATGAPIHTIDADRDEATGAFEASAFEILPDGQYTAQATQVDDAGNVGTGAARTFMLDATFPLISLTAPLPGTVTSDATPEFTGVAGTAPGDGATVEVKIVHQTELGPVAAQTASGQRDGATGAYAFSASPGLADGIYTASATQTDQAGNANVTAPRLFTVDTRAPAPTLTAPAADARTSDATPSFAGGGTAGDGDDGAVSVDVYPGAAPSGTAVATLDAPLDADGRYQVDATTPLADGTYTARASQADSAGNSGNSAARTFTVDAAAPAITLVAPENRASAAAMPTFSGVAGTAPGDDGIATVKVYAGGAAGGTVVQTLGATRDPATGAYSIASTFALADGTYTAQATQIDDVGHQGASATTTFTVGGRNDSGAPPDQRPPSLSRVGVSQRRFRTRTTLRYTLSEPATVTISITGPRSARAVGTLKRAGATGNNRIRLTTRIGRKRLKPGRYVMTIRATDAAGNRSRPRRLTFRIG
jgi:hypothetical protein